MINVKTAAVYSILIWKTVFRFFPVGQHRGPVKVHVPVHIRIFQFFAKGVHSCVSVSVKHVCANVASVSL